VQRLGRVTGAAALAMLLPSVCASIVERQGPRLVEDGRPFHAAGTNCYYLMVTAADPDRRHLVDEVLEEAAAMGLNAIRTWAFHDGGGRNALQTAPGIYDERVFRGLDYVLDRASGLGLRVILPLVNNWLDYGGMDQYVRWSETARFHDDFYTDLSCRSMYRGHLEAMTGRVNTVNGRRYRDDPTILAWELANEPRCLSDPTGNRLQGWIEEMSLHLKGLDPNHLVGTGSEGFFRDAEPGPWYRDGSQGVDFVRNHAAPGIDFAGGHSWPDPWGIGTGAAVELLARQVGEARDRLGKPFLLGEFGKLRDGAAAAPRARYDPATFFSPGVEPRPVPGARPIREGEERLTPPPGIHRSAALANTSARDRFFSEVFNLLVTERAGGGVTWASYHDAYPDYDGFGIYYPVDASTVAVIEGFAGAMAALSTAGGDTTFPGPAAWLVVGAARPNPFPGTVTLPVTVAAPARTARARVEVFDARGRRLGVLLDGLLGNGLHEVSWNGLDARGIPVPAGVYFAVVRSGGGVWTRRLVRVP